MARRRAAELGRNWAASLAGLAALALCAPALAQSAAGGADGFAVNANADLEPAEPVLFRADEMTYDLDSRVVSARGRVEIATGGRTLLADELTYDQGRDLVTASGNVSLTDRTGDVVFAERLRVTGDLADGVAEGVSALLSDDSRLIANRATRAGGEVSELEQAVYSPCDLCEEDPRRAPLWQIKAGKVIHNKTEREIVYRDARLEFFGVPVIYTPYFSHPDPTVKRKSGLLTPSVSTSGFYGGGLEVPYHWVIAPDKDATFSPFVSTRGDVIGKGEYRERTETGAWSMSGSLGYVEERDRDDKKTGNDQLRWHVFGDGRFRANEYVRWGFDVERASDDTYMRRFDISGQDRLTSQLFVEGSDERSYADLRGYVFQSLRDADDDNTTPIVLPVANLNYLHPEPVLGGQFELNANILNLFRTEGADTRRLSVEAGWSSGVTTSAGHVLSAFASIRGDLYHANDVIDFSGATPSERNGFHARALPLAGVEARWPFVSRGENFDQVIEPIAQLVASIDDGNPADIPNEDSASFEFDETNLFSPNKFPGLDLWEGGLRANLGVKWSAHFHSGGYASVTFGQSFRADGDTSFAEGSGLDSKVSDYVGRIEVRPVEWLDLVHRFRVDRQDFSFNRNEIEAYVGPDWLRAKFGYVYLDRELAPDDLPTREEFNGAVRWQVTDHWAVRANYRRDLQNSRSVEAGGGIEYLDECFSFELQLRRRYNRDRDLEPNDSIKLRFRLLNLG